MTAPYMHNGRFATLTDVVNFYDDGGAPVNIVKTNAHLSPTMPAKVSGGAKASVVDFLTNGLTDCRVQHDVAPFDHPALDLPNGPSLPARGKAGDGTTCP
jgi:cytochrome c peroxidase